MTLFGISKNVAVVLLREGGNHFVYINRAAQRSTAVPRHREINDYLARKICRDLQIAEL